MSRDIAETTAKAVIWVRKYSDVHKIFDRVPELPLEQHKSDGPLVAIIDLETMGLNHKACKITEIGIIIFSISSEGQFKGVHSVYSALNDPKQPIPPAITKLTGIDNKLVDGKSIKWDEVMDLIEPVEYVICHNAGFDRKFLENQTPSIVSDMFKTKKFGCTKNDVDWKAQGFANTKLDYLNWASGHYYDAHRAINDCWATLNIIRQTGSIPEVIKNINSSQGCIRLYNTAFRQKEAIKAAGYHWHAGLRCWEKDLKGIDIDSESQWGKHQIGASISLVEKDALVRYSERGI